MSEVEREFIKRLKKIIAWLVGILGAIVASVIIAGGAMGNALNTYMIKHDAEIRALVKSIDSKVNNDVILEYIKYNDKMMKLIMSGVDENHDAIKELRAEMKEFEIKYFSDNRVRGGKYDTIMYLPSYHWFICDDDTLFASLQMAYKNDIGLY